MMGADIKGKIYEGLFREERHGQWFRVQATLGHLPQYKLSAQKSSQSLVKPSQILHVVLEVFSWLKAIGFRELSIGP